MIAKTFQGLEEILAEELIVLGANDVQIGRRMVSFSGDKEMMYKANFCLRTAIRILKPIKHFKAKDADEVYEQIKAIAWEEILDVNKTFAVDAVVFSDEFGHSKFVSYKVKDAIVDYFRELNGKRPSVRINRPDVLLNIHIAQTTCTLSLDSSGESLHRRGYRRCIDYQTYPDRNPPISRMRTPYGTLPEQCYGQSMQLLQEWYLNRTSGQ